MSEKSYSGRWEIFRFRPYVLYFIGHTVSLLGTGMQFIATSWLAMQLTGNNASVAYVLIFTSLPGVVLSPVIGVFVDRFDRKWLAVLMDLFRAAVLVVIPFLWWEGLLEPWHLYTATFLIALGDEIYTPAAMSLIREVLPPKMLLYANSTNAIAMQTGAMLGAGIGGVIVSLSSAVVVMIINAVSFIISALCIVLIRKGIVRPTEMPQVSKVGYRRFMSEIRLGLSYIRSRHNIMIFYAMIFFIRMSLYTINVLLGPFTKETLKVGAVGFGYIDACFALGAVVGNLLLPSITRARGNNFVMVLGMIGTALSIFLFGFSESLGIAMFFYFLIGAFFQVGILYMTRAQEVTELSYQGRVHSTFNTFFSILSLGIYLGMAHLIEILSFRSLYLLQGIIVAFAAVMAYHALYIRPKNVMRNVST
ncbi:MFS transporter [Paenibacillus wynnii]|uniref:MFS transporter n=1 Tax=Paenibacillus wynnii TaxID=268407 RepID=UPI0027904D98|nr:MFS transporter [Paenibacillus wynnii]MDQ0195352.1 MFS family permease [Paenibacillus wynnii]